MKKETSQPILDKPNKQEPINPIVALYRLVNKITIETKNDEKINIVETSARCASVSHQLMIHSKCDIGKVLLYDTATEVDEYYLALTDVFSVFNEEYQQRVKYFLGPKEGNVSQCFQELDPQVKTVFVIDPFNLATVKKFFENLEIYKNLMPDFKFMVVINNAWKRNPSTVPKIVTKLFKDPEMIHYDEYLARSQKETAFGVGFPYRNWSVWK
jgi:hypothetical protein